MKRGDTFVKNIVLPYTPDAVSSKMRLDDEVTVYSSSINGASVTLSLPASATAELTVGRWAWDLQTTTADVVTTILEGDVSVSGDVSY